MKIHLVPWITITAIVFDILAITYMAYLAFYPFRTIEIIGQDQILNPNGKVRQSEALIYKVTYCKYTHTQAHINRLIIGNVTYSLPPSTNNIPVGCRTAISRNIIIPDGVEPGFYRLELTATYQVNPIRAIEVTHDSGSFEVLPKATSSSVSPTTSGDVESVVSAIGTPSAASVVGIPFGTDPTTQEPTWPAR